MYDLDMDREQRVEVSVRSKLTHNAMVELPRPISPIGVML